MALSDEEIRELISQHRGDLKAFERAKEAIAARLSELEGQPEVYERLHNWAGTQAAMNVLVMCTVQLRGVIEDLCDNIEKGATVLKLAEKRDE